MMQHVATTKSDVAAFTAKTDTQSFSESGGKDHFGSFLQEQTTQNSTVKSARSDATSQVFPEAKNDPNAAQKDSVQSARADKNNDRSTDAVETASKPNQTSKPGSTDVKPVEETASNSNDEKILNESESADTQDPIVNNAKAELAVELIKETLDRPKEQTADSTDSEEWVQLVDALKKLSADADNTEAPNQIDTAVSQTEANTASDTTIERVKDIAIDAVNKVAIGNVVQTEVVIPSQTEGHKESTTVDSLGNKVEQNKQLTAVLAPLIQQALDEAKLVGEPTQKSVEHTAIELLLNQPDVLKQLVGELSNQKVSTTQLSSVTGSELIPSDKAINTGLLKNGTTQADVALAENKALLAALLLDTQVSAKEVVAADKVSSATPTTGLPVGDINNVQQQNLNVTNIDGVDGKQTHNIEFQTNLMLTDLASDKSKQVNQSTNKELNLLIGLPESKLDKALENIAQRLFELTAKENKASAEIVSADKLVLPLVHPKMADLNVPAETAAKDFISQLKSGLEEFKQQLAQGREPGIDLKSLASEAIQKSADPSLAAKATVNLDKMVTNVTQVFDVAQTISRSIEHQQEHSINLAHRDVAQIQGEQSKQIQLNQFESKLDKAINITKPEGHQQLAEKVRWMVNTRNLVADIRLDPAELGSVQVRVAVSGESASVNFVVHSQSARDAVDTALPRLRELLAEKGLELGQSTVRQESQSQHWQGGDEQRRQPQNNQNNIEDLGQHEQVIAQHNVVNGSLGGIDYFV